MDLTEELKDPRIWARKLMAEAGELDDKEVIHWQEPPAHMILAMWQANLHAIRQLSDPQTHRDFEDLIKKDRLAYWLKGITHEACEEDAELVWADTIGKIALNWHVRIFP
jgi:hypothetical protein